MLAAVLRRGFIFSLLWWLLAEGDLQAWWLGAIAVALATATSLALMPPHHFLRPVAVIQFALFFLRNSIVSGVQVARLALDPCCRPQPHCVDVVLSLPEGPPRLIVAGALGLMPGTLSVRLEGAALHVHAIDAGIPVAVEAAALEAQVARMIGIEYGKAS